MKRGAVGGNDAVALDAAPQLQRLLLALFLLAADVGDHVVYDLGEGLKGFPGARNCLVGTDQHVGDAVPAQGMQRGYIALQAAVGLDGDKTAPGAQALALGGDDLDVVSVDLRHDHRDIRRKAMRAVVGDDRAFRLGIGFLQCLDLLFFSC